MTLTMTIVTPRVAYQCADYRLQDVETGRLFDFETQKTTLVNRSGWTALVAFAGVGRAAEVDVSEWLADKVDQLAFDAPFDALMDALLLADKEWLGAVWDPVLKRHTFSIGGFIGSSPMFGIVSNFEEPSGRVESTARPMLTAWVRKARRSVVFVSGQRQEVPRAERRRLRALAERDPDSTLIYDALAEVNRTVAARNNFVSEACWVVHARLTGDGGGRGFGLEGRPFLPRIAFPAGAQEVIRKLVAEQFGEGMGSLTAFSTMRAEATEEYHQTQLREKPRDPNVHSNYGAFLIDRGREDKAERQYRLALTIQPDHANALGNLANLESDRDRLDEAQDLYERAFASEPSHENVSWNFARFLFRRGDVAWALSVAATGSSKNPQSGRLHLLVGELRLSNGDAEGALARSQMLDPTAPIKRKLRHSTRSRRNYRAHRLAIASRPMK